jgi:hypothetical protein
MVDKNVTKKLYLSKTNLYNTIEGTTLLDPPSGLMDTLLDATV